MRKWYTCTAYIGSKTCLGCFFSNIYTIIFRWMSLKLSWIHDEHSVFSLSLKTSVIVELSLYKLYIASNLNFIESFLFKCENNLVLWSLILNLFFLIFRMKWDGKTDSRSDREKHKRNVRNQCVCETMIAKTHVPMTIETFRYQWSAHR